jgi:hypothetical protein
MWWIGCRKAELKHPINVEKNERNRGNDKKDDLFEVHCGEDLYYFYAPKMPTQNSNVTLDL